MKSATEYMQHGKTPQSATLLATLDYLALVRDLLVNQPPVAGHTVALSRAELALMEAACADGETPESFAARIVVRRTDIMQLGNVRRFLRDCCGGVDATEAALEVGRVRA